MLRSPSISSARSVSTGLGEIQSTPSIQVWPLRVRSKNWGLIFPNRSLQSRGLGNFLRAISIGEKGGGLQLKPHLTTGGEELKACLDKGRGSILP